MRRRCRRPSWCAGGGVERRLAGSSRALQVASQTTAAHAVLLSALCPSQLPQTDLNGDGKPEILTATPDGKLRLLAPRKFGDGFAKAEVRGRGMGLLSGCTAGCRRRPPPLPCQRPNRPGASLSLPLSTSSAPGAGRGAAGPDGRDEDRGHAQRLPQPAAQGARPRAAQAGARGGAASCCCCCCRGECRSPLVVSALFEQRASFAPLLPTLVVLRACRWWCW